MYVRMYLCLYVSICMPCAHLTLSMAPRSIMHAHTYQHTYIHMQIYYACTYIPTHIHTHADRDAQMRLSTIEWYAPAATLQMHKKPGPIMYAHTYAHTHRSLLSSLVSLLQGIPTIKLDYSKFPMGQPDIHTYMKHDTYNNSMVCSCSNTAHEQETRIYFSQPNWTSLMCGIPRPDLCVYVCMYMYACMHACMYNFCNRIGRA